MMNHYASNWPNHDVGFITLAKIPDSHPVRFARDWGGRFDPAIVALRDVPPQRLRSLNTLQFCRNETEAASLELPEIVLGIPLSEKYVKWTKDLRLLLHGDRRGRSAAPIPERLRHCCPSRPR